MRVAVMVGACVGALVLGACGDDEDEGGGGALTKSEFVAQGNAICAKQTAAFNKLFETSFPTTPAAMPAFFEKATPVLEAQVDQLRALEPPEADKATIDRLLAAGDRVVADFRRATRDEKFGADLFNEEGGASTAAFEKQATAYGLAKCAEDEEEEDEPAVDTSSFSAEKKAYIAEADEICARYTKQFTALEGRYFTTFPPELDVWAKFLPAVVAAGRRQLAELRELEPPAEEAAKVDALLDEQETIMSTFAQAGKLAAAGDQEGFTKISQPMFAAGEKSDENARAYGFKECGSEGN